MDLNSLKARAKTALGIVTGHWHGWLHWLVIGAAVFIAAWLWWALQHKPPQVVQELVPVPQEKVVEKIKREYVRVPQVQVLEKRVVVEKLKLPDWFKNQTSVEVTAAGLVERDRIHDTRVISTLNVENGRTEIMQQKVAPPFLRFEKDTEVGIRYGLGPDGQKGTVFGTCKLLGIGKAEVGLYGAVDYGMRTGRVEGEVGAQLTYPIDW